MPELRRFFYFRFLQKYIFVFKIYKNIPRPPRYRAAGTRSPCCRAAGTYLQKISRKNYIPIPGEPVARQRGGRPSRPPGSGSSRPTSYLQAQSMLIDQRARCVRTCIFLAGGFRSLDGDACPCFQQHRAVARVRAQRFIRPQDKSVGSCALVICSGSYVRSRSVSKRADYSLEQKNTSALSSCTHI